MSDKSDLIRDRVDIVAVVGEHVQLQPRGAQQVGECPFCRTTGRTLNVSAANKFFHCFGCKASGDVIVFMMKVEGCDLRSAIRMLNARRALVNR